MGELPSRYAEILNIINDCDTYTLKFDTNGNDLTCMPKVKIIDLINYLVLIHSEYSGSQLKIYNSLQHGKPF